MQLSDGGERVGGTSKPVQPDCAANEKYMKSNEVSLTLFSLGCHLGCNQEHYVFYHYVFNCIIIG